MLVYNDFVFKWRCSMIANETTGHQRPNDIEVKTTIGHHKAFNNEYKSFHIESYKGHEKTNLKQSKQEN